tara:strand:- start:1225 stop:1404 length:180 start_codon:yes stop_codon:yes gene_type:complete
MNLSKTKRNLQLARNLGTSGGVMIGGFDGHISLRNGIVRKNNIYGKVVTKINKNSSRRS